LGRFNIGRKKKHEYFDKKQEFIEHLSETYSTRLDMKQQAKCGDSYLRFQKCLKIDQQWYYKYSTGRYIVGAMFECHQPLHLYQKCMEDVDTPQIEQELQQEDQELVHNLFPK